MASVSIANVPFAIIPAIVRRSSSVTPGSAPGGYSTIDVPSWSGGPTVIQCMSLYPTSLRISMPRVSP